MVKAVGVTLFLVGTILGIVSGFVEGLSITTAIYGQLCGIGVMVVDHVLK